MRIENRPEDIESNLKEKVAKAQARFRSATGVLRQVYAMGRKAEVSTEYTKRIHLVAAEQGRAMEDVKSALEEWQKSAVS